MKEPGYSRRRKLVRGTLFSCGLGLFVYLAASSVEGLQNAPDMAATKVILIAGLYLANCVLAAVAFQIILSAVGSQMSWLSAFSLNTFASLAAFLVPTSGLVSRMVYLRQRHGLDYRVSGPAVIFVALVNVATIAILGLAASISVTLRYEEPVALAGVTLFLVILVLVALLISARRSALEGWLFGKIVALNLARDAWRELTANTSLLVRITVVQAGSLLIRTVRLAVCFEIIGATLQFDKILLIAQAGNISTVLGLLPQGIGVQELFIGVSAFALTNGYQMGIAAAVLDRLICVSVLFPIGALAFLYLLWLGRS